jgi:uncharacterized glyoxalase superfamily protein PhnB
MPGALTRGWAADLNPLHHQSPSSELPINDPMLGAATLTANVKQAVPFFGVTNMESSLRFYVEGLGFTMKRHWIPEGDDYPSNGKICWCWLELGNAAIMLQAFMPERQPKEPLGTGVSVCFQCEDSLVLYREFQSRGVTTRNRPFVGNGLWVVPLNDPDGYRIELASPTDAPEESELEEGE